MAAAKKSGKILRYPLSTIDKDTDYLSISIYKYQPGNLDITNRIGEKNAEGNHTIIKEAPKKKGFKTVNSASKSDHIKTIYLPVPSNIMDTNSVGWGEDSLNTFAAYGVDRIIDLMMEGNYLSGLKKQGEQIVSDFQGNTDDLRSMVNPFFASKAVNLIPGVQTTFAGLMARNSGKIVNPNKELLFNGVSLRSFSFSFDFAPRDLSEAQEIKKIIHCLKRNMVPNNEPSGGISFFLQTPNIFELQYKTGNKNHGFLNKFKIAALKNISVNYAGSGTYMTYNDKDKTPVHMQMNLQFQELVPLYQSDYGKDDENLENVGY